MIALKRMLPGLTILISLIGYVASVSAKQAVPGEFDYYALTLSWSPTFCSTPSGQQNHAQCSPGRRFAFVVHGLWPQFHKGWPSFCRSRESWVPKQQIRAMLDVMPSKGLIIHQWKKHGTCSGLDQKAYFRLTRDLFSRIKIPARYLSPTNPIQVAPSQLVTDFLRTNKNLRSDMLSVQCGNSRNRANLRELRICFTRKGQLTACGRNEQRSCRAQTLVLPPVR